MASSKKTSLTSASVYYIRSDLVLRHQVVSIIRGEIFMLEHTVKDIGRRVYACVNRNIYRFIKNFLVKLKGYRGIQACSCKEYIRLQQCNNYNLSKFNS